MEEEGPELVMEAWKSFQEPKTLKTGMSILGEEKGQGVGVCLQPYSRAPMSPRGTLGAPAELEGAPSTVLAEGLGRQHAPEARAANCPSSSLQ